MGREVFVQPPTCSVGRRQAALELESTLPTGVAQIYLETDGIKERPEKAKGETFFWPLGKIRTVKHVWWHP